MSGILIEPGTVGIIIDNENLKGGIIRINESLPGFSPGFLPEKMDYNRFVQVLSGGAKILFKKIYVPLFESIQPFIEYLEWNGFSVYGKEPKVIINKSDGKTITKANMDIEIAMGIMEMINLAKREHSPVPCPETVFLVTGDSDFAPLIPACFNANGIKVVVVSSKFSMSKELGEAADSTIFLEDVWSSVIRGSHASAVQNT